MRKRGYAINDQEIETGLRTIAVPLLDMLSRVVTAADIGVTAIQPKADALRGLCRGDPLRLRATLRQMIR